MWSDLRYRLSALFRRRALAADVEEELRAHLEHQAAKHLRAGATPEEALRRARLELGGLEQARELCHEASGVHGLEVFLQDVRYGLRGLRRNPGFAAIAVLTLALGVGVNTAIFSALNALLLRPLPIPQMDRVVYVLALRENFDPFGTGLADYQAYRERAHSYSSLGIDQQGSFNLIERGNSEALHGAFIVPGYLATLQVQPVLGRSFNEIECTPGGPGAALIGYGLWQRRFGGSSQIIGRTVNVNGNAVSIVGVMPANFDLPGETELWLPLQVRLEGLPAAERGTHDYELIGRLRPGVTLAQADAETKTIARQLEQELPEFRRGFGAELLTLRQQLIDDIDTNSERAVVILFGAVLFFLLICYANVAGLLLARGVVREHEIALRRALGAGPWRIACQLLTEGAVLAVFGGLGGLVLARPMMQALVALNPVQTLAFSTFLQDISLDGRVLGFVALVTLLTTLLCPLIPAAKAARARDLTSVFRQGSQRGNTDRAGRRWLGVLVVAEIAITVPLLVGGALLFRTFQSLYRVDVGFRPDHLLIAHLELPSTRYPDHKQRVAFVRNLIDKVEHLPGVVSAGITNNTPLTAVSRDSTFTVEGHPLDNPAALPVSSHRLVTPGYLKTLGITLVKGRLLNEQDREGSLPVVVVSEELARQAWPGEDPLGKHIRRGKQEQTGFPWLTVVGVVRNVKEDRFNFRIDRPVWYMPFEQQPSNYPLDLVVRTTVEPEKITDAVRHAAYSVDPEQPLSDMTTLQTQVAGVLTTDRFNALMMAALSILGLTLAVIGLYGVMAYTVTRQAREIGVRAALGATRTRILLATLGRAARLTGCGLLLGLAGAVASSRLLAGNLYGVRAMDPWIFAGVSALLLVVALAACLVPAWRAARVDPMVALRCE
ncbi:MAG TPA: ABC transporter permease [Candidatus Angelobacter sp.]|nr:ABC transporter permease [Candidatus Angelobacter sp.]